MTARQTAALCLVETESGGYSNLVFKRMVERGRVSKAEIPLCAAIFYGTLERLITIDYLLSKSLTRQVEKLDPEVRAILRSGVYQLHFMSGVPDYAAINESVKLCAFFKKRSASSVVNASLRKASSLDVGGLSETLEGEAALSVIHSLNPRLCRLLLSQYGPKAEELMRGFFAGEKQALRVNTLMTDCLTATEKLKEEGITAVRGPIPGCLVVEGANALTSGLFSDGSLRPQSYASQAAVHALMPCRGARMIDLCAAPGGKALTAAQLMLGDGEIVAFDRHAKRLKLLEQRAEIEGIGIIRTLVANSEVFIEEYEKTADYVLADVPCSGYGKIGTKPELRMKSPETDGRLEKAQYAILANGARYLKPGGRLVYSTCTVDKRENENLTGRFLEDNVEGYRSVSDICPFGFETVEKGFYSLLPSERGSEGFFMAVFERVK